ncbi:6523_t:CDS:2, partial [Funneliformis geosporum]
SITDVPNNRLLHDKNWKESNEKLAKVTLEEIFGKISPSVQSWLSHKVKRHI